MVGNVNRPRTLQRTSPPAGGNACALAARGRARRRGPGKKGGAGRMLAVHGRPKHPGQHTVSPNLTAITLVWDWISAEKDCQDPVVRHPIALCSPPCTRKLPRTVLSAVHETGV